MNAEPMSETKMLNKDWTEKYRPKDLKDVVGNSKAIRELENWASKWVSDKPSKKAVILAGKPGIGKTSSALALANHMNWEVLEMNASDQRNRDSIKDFVGRSAVDDTFSNSGDFTPYKEGKRTLLIIDEADNIFGREDRGGISEIKQTIKKTEQPMILIANDYYDLTRRSSELKNICKKIDFEPVDEKEIFKLLIQICNNEDIIYEKNVLERIAKYSEGDVRSAVRDLESIASGKDKLKREDLSVLGSRNREVDIFPTLKNILKNNDPLEAKRSVRYLDEEPPNLLTWIEENLPREYKGAKERYLGYKWLCRSDIYLGRVTNRQAYRLWSYSTDLMTAGVCASKDHQHKGWTRYSFPIWIRKMSGSKKERNIKRKISEKIAPYLHTTTENFKTEIFPYLTCLMKRKIEYREKAVKNYDLKPHEVAYLLEVDKDSPKVKSLFKERPEPRIEQTGKKKENESKGEESDEDKEEKEQRSLLEF